MAAAMLGERSGMRLPILIAALLVVPAAAHADPVQEARSATGACLSAIIEGAPVEDIDGDDVTIRRGQDPVSCTVRVTAGEPVLIRDAVMVALKRRSEIFSPARTPWEPAGWASRETFCNIPGRRSLAVFVSTAKPGARTVLTATVFETKDRDKRCDQDLGVQTVTANEPAPTATAPSAEGAAVAEPAKVETPPKPEKKKKGWLPRVPGFGHKD
jgi:hypothetical protein